MKRKRLRELQNYGNEAQTQTGLIAANAPVAVTGCHYVCVCVCVCVCVLAL